MFRNVPTCSGMFRVPGFIDGHFRFISVYILACVMSREFTPCTRDSVANVSTSSVSLNLMLMSSKRHLIHSKIFNLTKCREILLKYSLLIIPI